MKTKIIFVLTLITMLNLLAEDLSLFQSQQDKNRVEWIPPVSREVREKGFLIIPYTQIFLIFPGCGVTLRSSKQHFGIQGDINMTYIKFFETKTFIQVSVAGVYYPFISKDSSCNVGGWNITLGMGLFQNPIELEGEFMWGPLSIGYEGKRLFFDAGIVASGLMFIGRNRSDNKFFIYSDPVIAPLLKVGICF